MIKALLALVSLSVVALCVVVAPDLLFPYKRTLGAITIEDSKPIPPEADRVLAEINTALATGPFRVDVPLTLYVADGWRGRFFFAAAPNAGGVVYYPITRRHAFLSGADYHTGRLLNKGKVIKAPRTLAYYSIHELTHVLTGRAVGWKRFGDMPLWVREGLADYVALRAQGVPALGDPTPGGSVVMAPAKGSYPQYRALVAWALERDGWTITRLLATDLTAQQMVALIRQKSRG